MSLTLSSVEINRIISTDHRECDICSHKPEWSVITVFKEGSGGTVDIVCSQHVMDVVPSFTEKVTDDTITVDFG